MDHVAIMNKRLGLIDKILSGEKTIESRWYQNRCAPWDRIHINDTVYFKDSGGLVRAKATVTKVIQHANLALPKIKTILNEYGGVGRINIQDPTSFPEWYRLKKYCVLVFLTSPELLQPFNIDKSGFGSGSAWLIVQNIEQIKVRL